MKIYINYKIKIQNIKIKYLIYRLLFLNYNQNHKNLFIIIKLKYNSYFNKTKNYSII